jgi:hypothetical protein
VVHLRQQRNPPVRQTVDQVQLPQWPSPVQRARDDPRNLLRELPIASARRQGKLANVEVEVEVGILHPVRASDPQRYPCKLPAKRRQQVEPRPQKPAQIPDLDPPARRRGRIQNRQERDVPEVPNILDVQKLRIGGCQLPHLAPPSYPPAARQ